MIITTNITSKKKYPCFPLIFFICLSFLSIFNVKEVLGQQVSNTVRASISATITRPIGITKTNDLNIRSSTLDTSSDYETIKPDKSRKIRNGRILNISKGIANPASFNVTGEGTNTYSITLPSSVYVNSNIQGAKNVLVNNFTSQPTKSGILSSGVQTIFVGAIVIFSEPQSMNKIEDSGVFEIIFNYN